MIRFLNDFNLSSEDMKTSDCHQVFWLWHSRKYMSNMMIKIPQLVRRMDGKDDIIYDLDLIG